MASPSAEMGTAWAFRLLSVSREVTPSEAKRAYHRLLKRAHPDKGGDAATFLRVQQALQAVLQDLGRATARDWDWRQGRTAADGDAAPETPAEPAEEAVCNATVDPAQCSAAAAKRGASAFDASDFAAACAAYTEALVWSPGNAQLRVSRSQALLRLGRAADALTDAREALALRPRAAEAHVAAGAAMRALAMHAEAACAFKRALELDSKLTVRIAGAVEQMAAAQREAAVNACVAELRGCGTALAAIASSPLPGASFHIASLEVGGALRLWDGATGVCSATATAHDGGAVWADCSPCGAWMATGAADGTVKLWRALNGDGDGRAALEEAHILLGHTARVTCGAFSPDGARLVTGAADTHARVWCTATGLCERSLSGHAKYITCLAMSADGARVVTGSGDGTLKVWHVSSGEVWDEIDCVDSGAVTHVVWAADSPPKLMTAHYDLQKETSRVLAWDFAVKERTRPLQQYVAAFPKKGAYYGRVHSLHAVVGQEGQLAVVAVGDGTLMVLDARTCKPLFTQRGSHSAPTPAGSPLSASVTCARLSPCGLLMASGGVDKVVRVWSTEEGTQVAAFVGHAAPPQHLRWSPDAALLLSAAAGAAPRVWCIPSQ